MPKNVCEAQSSTKAKVRKVRYHIVEQPACKAFLETLQKFSIKAEDFCPICLKLGVHCFVVYHPSNMNIPTVVASKPASPVDDMVMFRSEHDIAEFIEGYEFHDPLLLHKIYRPVGSGNEIGFGSVLVGQEDAENDFAVNSYEFFEEWHKKNLNLRKILTKDTSRLSLCAQSVGSGKSAFISNGLQSLRKGLTMLHGRAYFDEFESIINEEPLVITISFTEYLFDEKEKNINHAIIRRILCALFRIRKDIVERIVIVENLMAEHLLHAILDKFRKMKGFSSDKKCFVYLGIDDIHKLIRPGHNSTILKALIDCLCGLQINSNDCYAILLAGTHFALITEAFRGSKIVKYNIFLKSLSLCEIKALLIECGISYKYFNNKEFTVLLQGIGHVMRAVGLVLENLDCEYTSVSIIRATRAVKNYFNQKMVNLSESAVRELVSIAATGRIVERGFLLSDSQWTPDLLQNEGTVVLHTLSSNDMYVMMSIPQPVIEGYLSSNTTEIEGIKMIVEKLYALTSTIQEDPKNVKRFVAHAVNFKLEHLNVSSLKTIPISTFFYDAVISNDIMDWEFRTDLPRGGIEEVIRFPDWLTEKTMFQVVVSHLRNFGVCVCLEDSFGDIIVGVQARKRSAGLPWKLCLLVFSLRYTSTDEILSPHDIYQTEDSLHYLLGSQSEELNVIAVLFSNCMVLQEASKTIDEHLSSNQLNRCIIVSRDSLECVIGPMMGKRLTINF